MEEVTTQADVTTPTNEVSDSSTQESSQSVQEDSSLVDGFWGEDTERTEKPEKEDKETESEYKKTESKESGEGQQDNKPFLKAEERKAELNEEIRSLVARRQELTREVAEYESMKELAQNIESNRVTPEQLEQAGLDPQDAAIQSLLYNQQVDVQKAQLAEIQSDIADLQYNLALDRVELVKNFPVFDEKSPEYDEEFAEKAIEMYKSAANLQVNEDGQPISASLRLYDYLSSLAQMRQAAYEAGMKGAQHARNKQSAAVMNAGGATANTSDGDETKAFVNNFFN